MKYNTINLTDEVLKELDDIYYPLRQKRKLKSYSELIRRLIKFYRKKKDERDTATNSD